MSFLKKLFGGSSFEELRAEADAHFLGKRFGEAKLAYDRALTKEKGAPASGVAHVRARIDESRDAIATERVGAAADFEKHGELELARAELESALETAASAEMTRSIERRLEALERGDARQRATAVEVSDDEVFEAMAGNWEPEQIEEYEAAGPRFREALLASNAGRFADAVTLLEALVASSKSPHYLHFELGLARISAENSAGGEEALRAFLGSIGPEEGGAARLAAHGSLAQLFDARGDEEAAVAELGLAIEALEEDPRPYIMLGNFLRKRGHADAAIDVLESAVTVIGEGQMDPFLQQELALAHRDAGHDADAEQRLELVIDAHVKQSRLDFPVESTVALAQLHEKRGNLKRAADLWRSLTRGSDRANHLRFHREAGRLLALLGLPDEARRMYQRAAELAEGDDEATRDVAAKLAALA
jgi:tetratricopeptide (TPR) repeat protein